MEDNFVAAFCIGEERVTLTYVRMFNGGQSRTFVVLYYPIQWETISVRLFRTRGARHMYVWDFIIHKPILDSFVTAFPAARRASHGRCVFPNTQRATRNTQRITQRNTQDAIPVVIWPLCVQTFLCWRKLEADTHKAFTNANNSKSGFHSFHFSCFMIFMFLVWNN